MHVVKLRRNSDGVIAHGLRPGDRVCMQFDTNRVRRHVVGCSANHFETVTYIRPSKGFRRHMRRVKAAGRHARPA